MAKETFERSVREADDRRLSSGTTGRQPRNRTIADSRHPGSHDRLGPRGGLASIDEILKRWFKVNKSQRRSTAEELASAWAKVVGEQIAKHTRIMDLNKAELVIAVDSAALLTELSTYYRLGILEALRHTAEFQSVQTIRFRSGEF